MALALRFLSSPSLCIREGGSEIEDAGAMLAAAVTVGAGGDMGGRMLVSGISMEVAFPQMTSYISSMFSATRLHARSIKARGNLI